MPFPWEVVMHTGLCLLRLPPHTFWALTPFEFFIMTGGLKAVADRLPRAELDRLMDTYPDQGEQDGCRRE
jgi:uncharacterized phage protein (TIGR02216 family)